MTAKLLLCISWFLVLTALCTYRCEDLAANPSVLPSVEQQAELSQLQIQPSPVSEQTQPQQTQSQQTQQQTQPQTRPHKTGGFLSFLEHEAGQVPKLLRKSMSALHQKFDSLHSKLNKVFQSHHHRHDGHSHHHRHGKHHQQQQQEGEPFSSGFDFSGLFPPVFLEDDNDLNVAVKMDAQRPAQSLKTWIPQMDVSETNTTFIVHVDLPGVSKEDIKVELLKKNILVIKGHRGKKQGSEAAKQDTAVSDENNVEGEEVHQEKEDKAEVSSKPQQQQQQQQPRQIVVERSFGSFYRSLELPQSVDRKAEIKAEFMDGVLTVELVKLERKKLRPAAIQVPVF